MHLNGEKMVKCYLMGKGDCELIIYPIDSNAKSLLFDSLLCMPGNTKAIKIYLNFKPKDR